MSRSIVSTGHLRVAINAAFCLFLILEIGLREMLDAAYGVVDQALLLVATTAACLLVAAAVSTGGRRRADASGQRT